MTASTAANAIPARTVTNVYVAIDMPKSRRLGLATARRNGKNSAELAARQINKPLTASNWPLDPAQ